MKKVTSTVKIYSSKVKMLTDAQIRALEQTANFLHSEVVQAQVIPFDSSHLQNTGTFVDYSNSKNGTVSIISQTPYARRLYFHPEYNFSKAHNPNAQGKWFEPWISGAEKDWCLNTYKEIYKQLGGV